MENPNQISPQPQPVQQTQQPKKWYGHKGLLSIIILTLIAATAVWVYFILNQPQNYGPIVVPHKISQPQQSAATTTASNSANPIQIEGINIFHELTATTTITPDGEFDIYTTASAQLSFPQNGDQFGDGFWISNGSDSAYLNYVSQTYDNTPDAKNASSVYIPNDLCPGSETMDCPLNEKIPFMPGEYYIYLKENQGTIKSNNYNVFINETTPDASYQNFSYFVLNSKSECSDQGYDTVDYCNGSLGQLNTSNDQYSVLIPNLWQALPELATTPGLVSLLFANQNSLFLKTFGYGAGEGFAFDISYYRFDLQSKQLTKLSYQEGTCPAVSTDKEYIADSLNAPTELRVFSLNENKYIYTKTFSNSQSLDDGTYGMGCNSSLNWGQDDSLNYTIYDASEPSDGEIPYPVISQERLSIPALPQ